MPYEDLRRGRYSVPGQAYILTATTRRRRALFARLPAIAVVARELLALEHEGRWCLHAWVVMPDHVHVVATLRQGSLAGAMRLLKGRTGRELGRRCIAAGPTWQPGYHDHAIRDDESLRSASMYICANPLRAGLANSLRDYCGWDAPDFREACIGMVLQTSG